MTDCTTMPACTHLFLADGGAHCRLPQHAHIAIECQTCTDYQPPHTTAVLRDDDRQRCEIWSRVMGYHRPVSAYNAGKRQEHADRVMFLEGASHD